MLRSFGQWLAVHCVCDANTACDQPTAQHATTAAVLLSVTRPPHTRLPPPAARRQASEHTHHVLHCCFGHTCRHPSLRSSLFRSHPSSSPTRLDVHPDQLDSLPASALKQLFAARSPCIGSAPACSCAACPSSSVRGCPHRLASCPLSLPSPSPLHLSTRGRERSQWRDSETPRIACLEARRPRVRFLHF